MSPEQRNKAIHSDAGVQFRYTKASHVAALGQGLALSGAPPSDVESHTPLVKLISCQPDVDRWEDFLLVHRLRAS